MEKGDDNDKIKNQIVNKDSDIKKIDINLHEVSKSICKLCYKNRFGTGFLIKLFKDEKELYCLMTNERVINKQMIELNEVIDVNYNYEKKWLKIKLDIKQRFIKYDLQKDITIVEMVPEDKIKEKYFLLPNTNEIKYVDEGIYIVQFPEGKYLSYSEGKIEKIENFEFTYNAGTKSGSSGSPIFLKNTKKVIGIHKKGNQHRKKNYGTLIYSFIQSLQSKKEIEEKNNIMVDNNSTEIYENGEYYIGQSLNGKKHGKGIIFDMYGNVKYDGDFSNGEKEGKGKYIYKDGKIYEGEWVKGKKNGKGIIYNKDGSILYEGDFVNDKREGNCKYIFEDGSYYIGQCKDDKMTGKGKLYLKNGELKYDGDYVNGIKEGNGKLMYDSGGYYIGQIQNGKRHGKEKNILRIMF